MSPVGHLTFPFCLKLESFSRTPRRDLPLPHRLYLPKGCYPLPRMGGKPCSVLSSLDTGLLPKGYNRALSHPETISEDRNRNRNRASSSWRAGEILITVFGLARTAFILFVDLAVFWLLSQCVKSLPPAPWTLKRDCLGWDMAED